MWFWIVKQNKVWFPPFDWVIVPLGTNLYTYGDMYEYWGTFYNSILILAGNEIGPRTNTEFIFISIMLMVGTFIKANIFGEMTVLIQVVSQKQVKFQSQIDSANTAMANLDIDPEIRQLVRSYFLFTQVTLDEQEGLKSFLGILSPSLKLQITAHIFSNQLKKKFFTNNAKADQMVKYLLKKLETVFCVPEEALVRQVSFCLQTPWFTRFHSREQPLSVTIITS